MKFFKQTFLSSLALMLVTPVFSEDQPTSAPASQPVSPEEVHTDSATDSETLSFPKTGETRMIEHDEAIQVTKEHGAEFLVLNYWATWCAPCVKELPYFESASNELADSGIRVVGFSMDYDVEPERWEAMTLSTLKRKEVTFSNFVLNVDSAETFPYFSNDWTGALPATFIFDSNGNKVAEHLAEFPTPEALIEFIKESTQEKEKSE